MTDGAAAVLTRLHAEGRLQGTAAVGGSGNSSIAARAMRELPIGVPKLIVSTVASGDTRPYVGAVDITMMYSVVDIAGINQVSSRILGNAAAAIAGMATAKLPPAGSDRPLVGATMFGVTTACVDRARERLEELGYEVLVFHATGTGGQSFEALITAGFFAGVLDATTTELADELVGGVLSAGPDRPEAAGRAGMPQVGRVEQWLEGEKRELGPGEAVSIPKGVVHASYTVGNTPARIAVILSPAAGEGGYEVVDVFEEEPWASLR